MIMVFTLLTKGGCFARAKIGHSSIVLELIKYCSTNERKEAQRCRLICITAGKAQFRHN